MINENLSKSIKDYFNKNTSKEALTELQDFLNNTLKEIQDKQQEAEKAIARARLGDSLAKDLTEYILSAPSIPQIIKDEIYKQPITREAIDQAVSFISQITNLCGEIEKDFNRVITLPPYSLNDPLTRFTSSF